jgi:hypothetical protein
MATRPWIVLGALLAAGCGGNSPVGPSAASTVNTESTPAPAPVPTPSPSTSPTFSGTVTDTVTGGLVPEFTAVINGGRVTVSAPGYVTRETSASAARVDLFPEAGFSLPFYRQLARAALSDLMEPLFVLPAAPAFYMEVDGAKGFSIATAGRLETVARRVVPQLTGGRFQVTRWETGPVPRTPQPGWIVIEREDFEGVTCGRALIGAVAGRIRLDANQKCQIEAIFAHELGHAFGFNHVDRYGALMYPTLDGKLTADAPIDLERHHMALAYARPRGNRDIDVDP